MATITTKNIARKVADATTVSYADARALVSEAIIDLRIQRVDYNTNLHAWEIEYRTGLALADHLIESN